MKKQRETAARTAPPAPSARRGEGGAIAFARRFSLPETRVVGYPDNTCGPVARQITRAIGSSGPISTNAYSWLRRQDDSSVRQSQNSAENPAWRGCGSSYSAYLSSDTHFWLAFAL